MGVDYKPVIWVRSKYVYDAVLILGVILYITIYLRLAPQYQDISLPLDNSVIRMRAFGSCAFLMLTIILCIGPLARLDTRFLPLLYNRRHFGVITFTVATIHAGHVLSWYFAFSSVQQIQGLLGSNTDYFQVLGFPFEAFGLVALLIMMVLAFTSHDFWLSFLGPPLWKALHMMVYVAYAALVLHVGLGALQGEASLFFKVLVLVSVFTVCGLHFISALKEKNFEQAKEMATPGDGWIVAGDVSDIPKESGIVVPVKDDERVAIFRYGEKISAISNVCAHQNGPLGEGRIIDGCVTCPWHGFQYNPANGRAPAPFTEKISTYNLKLEGDTIYLDIQANPPGTHVEPLIVGDKMPLHTE